MIDLIKTINIDVSNLSNDREIENYIPSQLINHYPDPSNLRYHFTVTGGKSRKTALVSFISREAIADRGEIKHPTLLFESKLKKDGQYIFVFSKTIQEIVLKNRCVISTHTLENRLENLNSILTDRSIIIYDRDNSGIIEGLDNRVIQLEKLYKSCKTSLFKKRRKSLLIPITFFVIITTLSMVTIGLLSRYRIAINEFNSVKNEYSLVVSQSNLESDLEARYNTLLEEHYTLKSGIEPDLYTLLYELSTGKTPKRIMNLNYSDYGINLNVLTTNGLTLTKDLNNSPNLHLRQNSSVSQDNYEVVSISGEVICH